MTVEIFDWDILASGNGFAAPDGFPEGMNYSSVNNAAREIMAVLARWQKDTNGSLVTTGSGNAYVVTPNRTISSYSNGLTFRFRANRANTGAVTLNVGAVGAASVVHPDNRALDAGEIANNGIYEVTYSTSLTAWVVMGTGSKATTSRKGDVALATDAEAIAGSATEKAVTPSNLTAMGVLGDAGRFTSSEISIATGTVVTASHGFGTTPFMVAAYLRCKVSNLGYSVGDEILLSASMGNTGGGTVEENGVQVGMSSTQVFGVIGDNQLEIYKKSSSAGGKSSITNSSWRIVLRAIK